MSLHTVFAFQNFLDTTTPTRFHTKTPSVATLLAKTLSVEGAARAYSHNITNIHEQWLLLVFLCCGVH